MRYKTFLYFSLSYSDLVLPIHCRCRGLLLHPITFRNSVRLLLTRVRPVAETAHNAHKRQTSLPSGRIRNRNPSKRAAADLYLKRCSHQDQPLVKNISLRITIFRDVTPSYFVLYRVPVVWYSKELKYDTVDSCRIICY
jgi:hypothetical protein